MYVQPPLILTEREDGLHRVRRPTITLSPGEAIVAFEGAADLIINHPESVPAELSDVVGGAASRLIRRYPTPEARIVALLWYLAGAAGMDLVYDDNTCLIRCAEGERGIRHGGLISIFINVLLRPVSPRVLLTTPGETCKSIEPTFIMTYNLARNADRSGALAETVAVLYQATTPHGFEALMRPEPRMQHSTRRRLEALVFGARDPVMKLYLAAVPKWMTPTEFARTFGPVSTRVIDPDVERRSILFNKLSSQSFFQ